MFETMGGTADDIAGLNQANPVALIDAAAEMLLHIGGKENIIAAEMIKTSILEVLAEGYYVGDIKKGPYQEAKGKDKLGTQEFAEKIAEKITELKQLKEIHPDKTIKQIAIDRADGEVKPLFERVLRSYEQYAKDMEPGSSNWVEHVKRNTPPNPVRAKSKIVGFDMFVDDSGMKVIFSADGSVDETATKIDPEVESCFFKISGIDIKTLFNEAKFGSIQSIRSFAQYCTRILRSYVDTDPIKSELIFAQLLNEMNVGQNFSERFSVSLKQMNSQQALVALEHFERESIKLVQSFYLVRARVLDPILHAHGFILARATSRGTEIYPTMCDFEKRDVDRFRIEVDPEGKLANEGYNHVLVQSKMMAALADIASKGWIISETMLNRSFTDGEGTKKGLEISGVSVPYAKSLGTNYADCSRDHDTKKSDILKPNFVC